jgi:hypothetical protein
MNTPAKSTTSPVKRLDFGLKQVMDAAREVAREENVPTHTFPRDVEKLASTTAAPDNSTEPVALQAETPAPKPAKPSITITTPAEKKPKAAQRAPVKRYSVDLPLYAIDDIRDKAHKARMTKREYILNALNEGGIAIKDIDIREPVDD